MIKSMSYVDANLAMSTEAESDDLTTGTFFGIIPTFDVMSRACYRRCMQLNGDDRRTIITKNNRCGETRKR